MQSDSYSQHWSSVVIVARVDKSYCLVIFGGLPTSGNHCITSKFESRAYHLRLRALRGDMLELLVFLS